MQSKNIRITKDSMGYYIILVNNKVVKNPNRCPMSVATYKSEQEAKEYISNNKLYV